MDWYLSTTAFDHISWRGLEPFLRLVFISANVANVNLSKAKAGVDLLPLWVKG